MLDPKKQSELIAEKSVQVFNELKVFQTHAIKNLNTGEEISSFKLFKDSDVQEAIHGAVASGYLLALQTMQQASQMQTAPEIKDELNSHENVRGM